MRKTFIAAVSTVLLVGALAAPTLAEVNDVTPSTNQQNSTEGWAHFDVVDTGIGEVTVDFISTRAFASCFEYRSDGDLSQSIGANPNPDIDDGRYPSTCENNSTTRETLTADAYVEIRMVFGAERDERFDWTRLDVLPDAQTKADCKDGGWGAYGFDNQGQCVRYIETGRDSR